MTAVPVIVGWCVPVSGLLAASSQYYPLPAPVLVGAGLTSGGLGSKQVPRNIWDQKLSSCRSSGQRGTEDDAELPAGNSRAVNYGPRFLSFSFSHCEVKKSTLMN